MMIQDMGPSQSPKSSNSMVNGEICVPMERTLGGRCGNQMPNINLWGEWRELGPAFPKRTCCVWDRHLYCVSIPFF